MSLDISTDYDWVFPLLALTIYVVTPKGCDKKVNWVLFGLFVLVWSFRESAAAASKIEFLQPYFYDGINFDITLFLIYSWCAYMLHGLGGRVQRNLAIAGAALCFIYGYYGEKTLYANGDVELDMFHNEVFIGLYILQLFVAGGGMMFALSNKLINGDAHVISNRHNGPTARRNNTDIGDT